MSRDTDWSLVGMVLGVLLILALTVWIAYRQMHAPCSELGSLPVRDLPARCLDGYRGPQ